MNSISPEQVGKEAEGIRSKITSLSVAYLGTPSEEGNHWSDMIAVSMAKDAIRVNAEVMSMPPKQGSPSSVADQITSGLAKIYQHSTPCSGL